MFNNILQYYYISNYFHGYLMYVIALPIISKYCKCVWTILTAGLQIDKLYYNHANNYPTIVLISYC